MCLDQAKGPESLARCHVLSVLRARYSMCLDQAKGLGNLASCYVLEDSMCLHQARGPGNLASCVLENPILARVNLRYRLEYRLAEILLCELVCILLSLHLGNFPLWLADQFNFFQHVAAGGCWVLSYF